eukprot:4345617-Alexandrium_andersonii.AAC.1
MSASLVGSEMCIRDSRWPPGPLQPQAKPAPASPAVRPPSSPPLPPGAYSAPRALGERAPRG